MAHPQAVPAVWGKVPLRNKNFTGREELLTELKTAISRQVTAVLPHALHGLGGVGKTQMAVEFAYRYQVDYDIVWWVPADQPKLVLPMLANLAPHLGLPSSAILGVEDAANAVLDALRRGDPYGRWLVIFDNADEPEDLQGLLPQGGHVLITSRNPRWDSVGHTVQVDVFTREESIAFLDKRVPRTINEGDADRLAHELGDLPLALEQAGALQAETGISAAEYLRLLAEYTRRLLAEGRPTEYPASMTAAWRLSVDSLREKLPEAVELLRCCAFFGPEPIPREVFSRTPPGMSQPLAGLLRNPIKLARAFGEVGRYALAKIDSASRTVQVHRLIQALLRDELSPADQARFRGEVHMLLVAAMPPDDVDSPTSWRRYAELTQHVEPAAVAQSQDPDVRKFALSIVRYLRQSGDFAFAQTLVERLLDQWAADSGEDDLDLLGGKRHFGIILRDRGEYGAAYESNLKAMERTETLVGPSHPMTLQLLNSLGADLRARGDFSDARDHDLRSVERHEEVFGPTAVDTLRAMHNLALDHSLNSDHAKSRDLHETVYLRYTTSANASMTNVNSALGGLARSVRLCGDFAEACDLGEEAYAKCVDEVGPEHPLTLHVAKDLTIALRRSGELARALELAKENHARYVRLFGLDHPDTLASAMSLANCRRSLGDLDSALELTADTVVRYPKVYGPEHPYSHGCAGNLAVLRRVLGDAESARRVNEKALAGLEVKLGRDHHYSLSVATNLASDLLALEETDSASRLGRGTLRRLRATVGEEHPLTMACAANLAVALRANGEEDEAARQHKEVMDVYARRLGLEHPDAVVAAEWRSLDCDFDPPPI
ncbi:FxSxx-COOH system tetratricopeptide repeat protein [Actinomadura chibensis]|uniref:Tetratricopeptide repeat protein n=1 Tax=Actinomadura chibensis TaxID=392828 RepID=A0A5D0NMQ8_9ACTN|nr:FxSxx-COOH system tetratricopeptide repeat protein [Actinomadura chibensis]TYB45281.1 tetratricopeptide repeat protein [Actinomadura chibensis]